MAMVQKTSSSLEPTPQLKRAWQLLGYRRYLPRAHFFTQQSKISQTASEGFVEHPRLSAQQSDCLSFLPHSQLSTDNQSMPTGYAIGNLHLFDAQTFTIIYAEKSSLVWIFPPLWYRNASFYLFAQIAEEELFLNALQSVGLAKIAESFKQVFAQSFTQAPRYAISEISLVKRFLERQWVNVGSDRLIEQLIEQGYGFSIKPLKLTHPTLLLDNPLEKRTLWIELLTLAQLENI